VALFFRDALIGNLAATVDCHVLHTASLNLQLTTWEEYCQAPKGKTRHGERLDASLEEYFRGLKNKMSNEGLDLVPLLKMATALYSECLGGY
jgi:hypothetical protein